MTLLCIVDMGWYMTLLIWAVKWHCYVLSIWAGKWHCYVVSMWAGKWHCYVLSIWSGKWHCYVMSILPNTVEFCWVYLNKQCLNDGDLFENKRIRKQRYVAKCLTTTNDCIVSIHTFYQTLYYVTMVLSLATMLSLFIVLFSTNCVHQTVTTSTERNLTRLFYCLHNTSSLKTILMAQIHGLFYCHYKTSRLEEGNRRFEKRKMCLLLL